MQRSEESDARLRLAVRILMQMRCWDRQPILQSEVAELRFLAESEDEMKLPLGELAAAILRRETTRMGFPPHADFRPGQTFPN